MIELEEIIKILKPIKVVGNINRKVVNVSSFSESQNSHETICWLNEKNKNLVFTVKNCIIICPSTISEEQLPNDCTFLLFNNPREAFRKLLQHFFQKARPDAKVEKSAVIGNGVILGENVYIGHNTVIEDNVSIGDNSVILHNNSILYGTKIGTNVMIGSNNTIGGIGFGYEKSESGSYEPIPHIGNVVIENYVEIGNCTCIDRAVLGSTILHENCKIDNLVHIAHGVIIGKNTLLIAHSMIGGSTTIGDNVWIAPGALLLNKISISNDAVVGMGAVVIKSVNEKEVVAGNPAKYLKTIK